MCKLIEDLQEEAKKEALLDNIRSLMETMNLTAQQAMNALKVPVNKQKEYFDLIQASIQVTKKNNCSKLDGGQIFYNVQSFQANGD